MNFACVLATALTIFSVNVPAAQQEQASASGPATQAPAATESVQTPPAAQTEPPKPDSAKKGTSKVGTRKRRARKPSATEGEPRKIVVHQGGVSEPVAQIVPGITQEEATRQRQSAQEMLASTDANLKRLAARTLTSNQQDTIAQIRHYLDGAQSALKDGDTQRAHTLAQKAYLLSDDLVKH
jgi:hypothetical protein